jgi:hypothetical protein
MALGEAGGAYPVAISYGAKGHRKTIKPRKGPAPPGRVRKGSGTVSYYVRPRGRR